MFFVYAKGYLIFGSTVNKTYSGYYFYLPFTFDVFFSFTERYFFFLRSLFHFSFCSQKEKTFE